LAIPKNSEGKKLPAVLLLHGWNLFWGKNEDWVQQWIPLLTAQGYAVLAPDHVNYGERRSADTSRLEDFRSPYAARDWMSQAVVDLRRGIDYLLTRPEVDPGRIAILGGSMGGWIGSILAGVEPRIKTAVLCVPAMEFVTGQTSAWRVANSRNFIPRYSGLSLLFVIAKRDSEERNQRSRRLFELAPVRKKMVEYDDEHFLPPQKYNQDILQWLEENL
jgi:dienelactone hydrolase